MMIHQSTLQEVTSQNYLIHDLPSGSSTEETNITKILDNLSSTWIRQKSEECFYPYPNLLPLLEIDWSTVLRLLPLLEIDWSTVLRPFFEVKSETSLVEIKEISEEAIVTGVMKHDFIVRMPPIKEYTLRVKVKSIEKATPHIVEPEGVQ
jgi:hypothetical protein